MKMILCKEISVYDFAKLQIQRNKYMDFINKMERKFEKVTLNKAIS